MIYQKSPFCPLNNGMDNRSYSDGSNENNSYKTLVPQNNYNSVRPDDQNGKIPLYNSNNENLTDRQRNDVNFDSAVPNDKCENCTDGGKEELMNLINEMTFAATDLNLFLDTHPDNTEALKTFTKICASLKSLKHDYVQKYGPITAADSTDQTPFEWVSQKYKWPWQL